MLWILLLIVLIIVVAVVLFRLVPEQVERPDYKRGAFLSAAEKEFMRALDSAVGGKYRIFAKVRLADLIMPTAGEKASWRRRFNRVNSKHVDFLLCGKEDLEPVCAIELDDRTHQAQTRIERDDFVDGALKSAGVPIVRFHVSRQYVCGDIASAIAAGTAAEAAAVPGPNCPKCGKQMAMRKAGSGPNAGRFFWGCTGYPGCKGIVSIAENP